MKDLTAIDIREISAGKFKLKINIGTLIGAITTGFVTGGPAGVGIAVAAAVIAQGVGSLQELHETGELT